MNYVFIYNSLKSDGSYNQRLLNIGGQLISSAISIGGSKLYSVGAGEKIIPALVMEPSNDVVSGELYSVPSFDQLDLWEGHPNHFERRKIQVAVHSTGKIEEVWAYFFKDRNAVKERGEKLENGKWEESHWFLPMGNVA